MEDCEKNYFYDKRVIVYQGKKGYRFSVDAPLLADFIPELKEKTALEIGCGSGIISLLLIYRNKFKKIFAYEIQKSLAEIASLNVEENYFSDRIEIINEDFLEKAEIALEKNGKKLDVVFSNPPFYKINMGRLSADKEVASAKFELKINIELLLKRTKSILKDGGDVFLIFPYERISELDKLIKKYSYKTIRRRDIVSYQGRKPERFMIQLRNNGLDDGYGDIDNPLIIYKENGSYTEEMDVIFGKSRG